MRLATLVLIGCVAACSAPSEPDGDLTLGAIAGYLDGDPQIAIEAAGSALTVRVTTYGNSCYSLGRTEVTVAGRTAIVSPYDQVDMTGACLDILRALAHEVRIDFGRGGFATIIVRGIDRSRTSDDHPSGTVIKVKREVAIP